MLSVIYTITNRFLYVSQFVSMKVSLNDRIKGDMPNNSDRLELALNLMFWVFGLISPFLTITPLIRAATIIPVTMLFVTESYIRYGSLTVNSISRLIYPSILLLAIVFFPSVVMISLINLFRVIWVLFIKNEVKKVIKGFSNSYGKEHLFVKFMENCFIEELSESSRPEDMFSLAIHFLVKHLTTLLNIVLFSSFAFILYTEVLLSTSMVLTLIFFSIFALRDLGLFDASANKSLVRILEKSRLLSLLEHYMGRVVLLFIHGGRFIEPLVRIIAKTLWPKDSMEEMYFYSEIVKKENQSYIDSLLSHREVLREKSRCNTSFSRHYQLMRNMMLGTAYKFDEKSGGELPAILERIQSSLENDLDENYSLSMRQGVVISGEAVINLDKQSIKGKLSSTINTIIQGRDHFVAFPEIDELRGLMANALSALEKALREKDKAEIDYILKSILTEDNTCAGGAYSAYKADLDKYSVNLEYLKNIEVLKDENQQSSYQIVPEFDPESDSYFVRNAHEMQASLEILSPSSKEDRHHYHDYCGMYSRGHYTLSHHAAKADNGSFASRGGTLLLGYTSWYAVEEFNANSVDKYFNAIKMQDALRELWQHKFPELMEMTLDDLKELCQAELQSQGGGAMEDAWNDILRMEQDNCYADDLDYHLQSYWFEILSEAILVNELASHGYIAKHEDILWPTRGLYLSHIYRATRDLAYDVFIGSRVLMGDVANISLNILYSPIRAVELAMEPSIAKATLAEKSPKGEQFLKDVLASV